MVISHSYVVVYQRVMKLFMLDGITFFVYMFVLCVLHTYIYIYTHICMMVNDEHGMIIPTDMVDFSDGLKLKLPTR